MKKTAVKSLTLIISIICIFSLVACNQVDATGLWETATYLSDATIGNGQKTVLVDIEVTDQKITLTLKTDKNTLGDALYEHGLINDATFFDTINGMKADWDKDGAYWAFYIGDELMNIGVGDETVEGGEHYRFVYTKY